MSKRSKMNKTFSKKVFTKGAQRVHHKNHLTQTYVMRGGIRL